MKDQRSAAFYDSRPILVTVESVRRYGPAKAVILQQVHYLSTWASDTGWASGTYDEWAERTGLTAPQVKHLLLSLRKDGFVDARTAKASGFDRTIEYRLTALTLGVSSDESVRDSSDESVRDTRTNPSDVPLSLEVVLESSFTRERERASGPSFADFWTAYPRKTAKGAAETAWTKALKATTAESIVAGAVRFAADPNRLDEFTPHASTWLNQKRWDDEPLPARTSGRSPVKAKPLLSERTARPSATVITDGSDW